MAATDAQEIGNGQEAPSAPLSTEVPSAAPRRQVVKSASKARNQVVIEDDEAASSEEEGKAGPKVQEEPAEEEAGEGAEVSHVPGHFSQRKRWKTAALAAKVAPKVKVTNLSDFLGASAETSDLLPFMKGWLDKARPGWFNTWQQRYFVLCKKQLQWFSNPSDNVPLGTLDFDLVDCEVERLWSKQETTAAATGPKARGYCGGCDPASAVISSMSKVRFRICPVGDDRAFELRALHAKEGDAWVEALSQHISCSHAEAHITRAPSMLDSFGRKKWWKVRRISPEKFSKIAQTGDILLFRSEGGAPKVIRAASGGRFDHVALILCLADNEIGLFEATGNLGVGLCTWQEFVENDWQELYPELAIRRVRFPRTADRLTALERWCSEVNGRPYGLSVGKLSQRKSVSAGGEATDGSFFCSELVAEALKVLGVLPRGVSSTQFWPSSFEASHSLPAEPMEGCCLGEELTIDFSLSSRPKASVSASDGAGKQQRDVTTNW